MRPQIRRTHIYNCSVTGVEACMGMTICRWQSVCCERDLKPKDSSCSLRARACFLAVAEELLGGLEVEHASAAEALLERLGDMCATAAEALAEDGGDDEVAGLGRVAGKALGAAITSMGPAAVLQNLPLTLEASAPPALCTSCSRESHQSS